MASRNRKGLVGWSRSVVQWRLGRTLYLSVPFTWLVGEAEEIARDHTRRKRGPVVAGGPGIALLYPDGCEWAKTPESVPFDTLAMHNPMAGISTRGCPNRCPFCAVPRLEGEFRELPESTWKLGPVRTDANLLAASKEHVEELVDRLVHAAVPHVDFNQGLDARRFTPWHAQQLARLDKAMLRFSWDGTGAGPVVHRATTLARAAGFPARRIRVFVLVGFEDSLEEARDRCETVRGWGLKPNPMRYQRLDARRRNEYVGEGWTANDLRRLCRYYARDIFRQIPFEEFELREGPAQLDLKVV